MLTHGATHRGAPFVGRNREIGILTHLIHEGLAGSLGLVQVSGERGVGRRRLLAEALKHGPDAEWIHLAPGGVEADLPRWVRTELPDLLDTYPETPVPSWALHVLARWSPALRRRAAVPASPPEGLPAREADSVLGAAVGAVLTALTGRTLIIADAGLWPSPGPVARQMRALSRALRSPGAILLAAAPIQKSWDPDDVRTLRLEPLRPRDVERLCTHWNVSDAAGFARWLSVITSGHPFFIHEVVRWLEELGHLVVDEDGKKIRLLDPVPRLPVPLFLDAVLEARYRRLPPDAARVLHLVSQHDGRCEIETLRARFGSGEEEFDEAFSILRRREFFLSRTSRHPVALASPIWHRALRKGVLQFPRNAFSGKPNGNGHEFGESSPILARTLKELRRAEGIDPPSLALIWRRARGRLGPAWSGVRGRLAVRAARLRLIQGNPVKAALWVKWGLRHLTPKVHPSLRRGLRRIMAEVAAGTGNPGNAHAQVTKARNEALAAGHLVAAAKLRAAAAEGRRRLGHLHAARDLAFRAEQELGAMGLPAWERLAAFTYLSALLDLRDLDRAAVGLERRRHRGWDLSDVDARLDHLGKTPPVLRTETETPSGWGWGLDHPSGWGDACRSLEEKFSATRISSPFPLLEADRREMVLLSRVHANPEDPAVEADMDAAGSANHALGAPERNAFLAAALEEFPHRDLASYQSWFQPHLLGAVRPAPTLPGIRLFLFGNPRVEAGTVVWPLSLWPEGWMRLWVRLLSAELSGSSLSRENAERLLAETTAIDLESVVYRGNELLRQGSRIAGGIKILDRELVMDWTGIKCDAREVVELLRGSHAALDPEDLFRLLEKTLSLPEGPFLPGVEDPEVNALRKRLARELARVLRLRLETAPAVSQDQRVRWLEAYTGWLDPEALEPLREKPPGRVEFPLASP